MLINSDHRRWAVASGLGTAAATVAYGVYVWRSPYGPSGGSWPGLIFGILGMSFMVIAGLLALRKRMRIRRVGSAQLWLRMHIWLSLVAIPLIWFHSGFALGGPLTTLLMTLFYIVILTGIGGLALQQVLPRVMTERVPLETVRVQIEHVNEGLAASAYELVAGVAGPIEAAGPERARIDAELEVEKVRLAYWKKSDREPPAEERDPRAAALERVYLEEIRPYLRRRAGDTRTSPPDVRRRLSELPDEWQGRVDKLEALVEESRQLGVQVRLHRLLHNWLFIHAPVSFAMFVLAIFHIIFALRY